MSLQPDEQPVGALVRALDSAKPEDLATIGLADEAARAELIADTRKLGLVGVITLLAASGAGDPAIAAETPTRVKEELAKAIGEGAVQGPVPSDLAGLLKVYAEKKGAR